MNTPLIITILFAVIGGIVPIYLWLCFWLHEDKVQPEPKILLFFTFLGGMIGTIVALFFEKLIYTSGLISIFEVGYLYQIGNFLQNFVQSNYTIEKILMVTVFAPIIEELIKFFAGYFIAIKNKANDEPIDPVIYMITVALGFAAVENILFLIDPISKNTLIFSILTGNMRFIGASVLHTISSAVIGMFMGFSYFKTKTERILYTILGIVTAILLHSAFNFSIIMKGGNNAMIAMECVWIAVVILLLLFERIKNIKLNKI
ncbi:MAG: PrsW family glutamic-type intramembrane protease [Minisyncoccia bacterium]